MPRTKSLPKLLALALSLAVGGRAVAADKLVVGALHVGSIKDAGYNQASHEGLEQLKKNIPGLVLLGALLFGGTLALQIQLQARGAQVSPFLLDMLPYLATLAVLVLLRKASRGRMPEGLREVFESST